MKSNRIFSSTAIKVLTLVALVFCAFAVSCRSRSGLGDRDIDGYFAQAAWQGDIPKMEALLAKGADVNKTCCGTPPPIMGAASAGHDDAIKFLIKHGADVNIRGKDRVSALMMAVAGNHLSTVNLLIENGADVNACDTFDEETPLGTAKKHGYIEIIKTLQSHRAAEKPSLGGLSCKF